jgi:hypothetical protein
MRVHFLQKYFPAAYPFAHAVFYVAECLLCFHVLILAGLWDLISGSLDECGVNRHLQREYARAPRGTNDINNKAVLL